jgi:hypothetical protein
MVTSANGQAPAVRDARVNVRITEAGRLAIAERARLSGYSESDVVRMLLSYGLQHMPPIAPKGIRL